VTVDVDNVAEVFHANTCYLGVPSFDGTKQLFWQPFALARQFAIAFLGRHMDVCGRLCLVLLCPMTYLCIVLDTLVV